VEVPLLLQFSIALFTGMVAATFVPPVRRAIPRPVEVILWVALLAVCVIGVMSITDPNARELSASAAWGAEQILNTTVGLMLGGVGSWMSDHRFAIASWLIIIAGADIFALIFIASWRSARAWEPRVRLREWMELPLPSQVSARRPVVTADPLAGLNRRLAAATALAGASVLGAIVDASIWFRDVMLPRGARRLAHAAAVGRVESRARLEGLREATAHLQFAAHAWYAAACQPAVSGLAGKATGAVRTARAAQRSLRPAGQVIDIQAILSAQSIGWYGPFSTVPVPPLEGDHDVTEPEQSDRLAS
jgi:hypothetical protein